MGVTSFRALVAPFLVDSLELERRVLESPLAGECSRASSRSGSSASRILPGPLRRPFGLSRPLVGPEDYAGATIGIRYGGVAQDTIEALGATPKGYRIGSLAGLDGAELDLKTIAGNGYDSRGGRAHRERRPLGAAGDDRHQPRGVRPARSGAAGDPAPRRPGGARAGAAPASRGSRRRRWPPCAARKVSLDQPRPPSSRRCASAVQPVYDGLERDPRDEAADRGDPEAARAEPRPRARALPDAQSGASELEGVWESSVTRAAMLADGASPAEAATYAGSGTLELKDGRWTFRGDRTTVTGTYAVSGDALRLTMLTCTANPCLPGATPSTRGASTATRCRSRGAPAARSGRDSSRSRVVGSGESLARLRGDAGGRRRRGHRGLQWVGWRQGRWSAAEESRWS